MLTIQERFGVLSEPLEASLWQWACMLRFAIPGQVVSFDPVEQTCVVRIMIQERMWMPPKTDDPNPLPGNTQNVPTWNAIPDLPDVPIIMMRAGGWSLTFPIVAGSECLLIFADNCCDGWSQSGKLSPQHDRRRHALSDCFALFGPWSQPNKLTGYSTTSMQLRSDDGTTYIELAPGGVVNVVAPGGFHVTAPTIVLAGGVTVDGALTASEGMDITGNMTLTGDLESIGNIHTTGNIVAEGTIVSGSPVFAASRISEVQKGSIAAEVNFLTLGDVEAEGNLTVQGTIYAADDISSGTHVRALGDVTSAQRTISLTDHIHEQQNKPTSPPIPLVTAVQPAPEPPPAEPKAE